MITAELWFWRTLCAVLAALASYLFSRARRISRTEQSATFGLGEQSVEAEDVLKAAYTLETAGDFTVEQLTRSLGLPTAMADAVIDALIASGWVARDRTGGLRLKQAGKARAVELIRAHRLWERYLVEKEGASLHTVHAEAHRREHHITPEELHRLDADLGHPAWDPHGHFIPGPGGREPQAASRPLSGDEKAGSRFRIVSLKEEPAPLLAQLVALGLKPGVDVEVAGNDSNVVQLRVNELTVPLAREAAQHVSVVPAPALTIPLGELPAGSRAHVVEIQGEGNHQRRMLDIGFVPGAEVAVIRKAPLNDPVEYLVKGTNVALRREEADTILVGELQSD
jgi:Fe2+ transport system protein FeoA/Mn-dependent DtxR family transcriptional regulator